MVDFRYNMEMYYKNREFIKYYNYKDSLLRYYIIITQQN